jgi:N-acetylglutamate synthase-like GNAT family acetyltransferase
MFEWKEYGKNWIVRSAVIGDAAFLAETINEAFLADAYFKKEQYHLRTNVNEVTRIIEKKEEDEKEFLVYVDAQTGTPQGCVQVNLEKKSGEVHGHFGMLSVPDRFQKQGVGSILVDAVHKYFQSKSVKVIEMPVIDSRVDLVAWYSKRGFQAVDKVDFSYPEILKDGMQVKFIIFQKRITP